MAHTPSPGLGAPAQTVTSEHSPVRPQHTPQDGTERMNWRQRDSPRKNAARWPRDWAVCPHRLPARALGADRKQLEPAPKFCRRDGLGRGARDHQPSGGAVGPRTDLTAQARGAPPEVTFRAGEPLSKALDRANIFLGTKGLKFVSQPSTPS